MPDNDIDFTPQPISLEMPSDSDEISQDITVRKMNIREFRELGFVHEINRLILHPCGLALEVELRPDGTERLGGVWDCREDPEGIAYGPDYINGEKAAQVAKLIEARGMTRGPALGYIVQPVDAEHTQLGLTIKEFVTHSSSADDDTAGDDSEH